MERYSHFAQQYRLGYKILLICVAKGRPMPKVFWYKDGREVEMRPNVHITERRVRRGSMKSRIEIDPATLGDQGTYMCLASNPYTFDHRTFKTEYIY